MTQMPPIPEQQEPAPSWDELSELCRVLAKRMITSQNPVVQDIMGLIGVAGYADDKAQGRADTELWQ